MTTLTDGIIVDEIAQEEWLNSQPEPALTKNATTVLEKRYLRKDKNLDFTETTKELFGRVAWSVAQGDVDKATLYYMVMTTGEFMPNSPTLFNAGTGNGLGLSACYILVPEDNLKSIMQVTTDLALIQKAGGGVGYDFSRLRPRTCLVRSCGATTDGPLPFIDLYCAATNAIQQGAKRRGAQMGMLWCLDGGTRIHTLQGRRPIRDLVGTRPMLYSTDGCGNLFVEQADKVWKVGTKKVVRVHMDNDSHIDCTPDHRFMLSDGSFTEAGDLQPGTSLMAFHKHLDKRGYLNVGVTGQGSQLEHKIVASQHLGNTEGLHVHHKNEIKIDNRPENLELMTKSEHTKLHFAQTMRENQARITEARKGKTLDEWLGKEKSKAVREKMSTGQKKRFETEEPWNKGSACACSPTGTPHHENCKAGEHINNHRVLWVEDLDEEREVFDIQMPTHHNFAAEEVFVHNCWHPDIWDFIHAKENLSRWQNMNVSIKVTDDWMEKVLTDPHTPHEVHHNEWGEGILVRMKDTGRVVAAKHGKHHPDTSTPVTTGELFAEICKLAHKNGEPGLAFWDRVNQDWVFKSTGDYPLEATNPCGEVPGEDGMSCNLASINLIKFLTPEGDFDAQRFVTAVHMGIEFLDNVVEINTFPVKKIADMNRETRRVGLGIMGFADLLFGMGIPYDSDKARQLAREIGKILKEEALTKSVMMAKEKGSFPTADRSDYIGQAPRNAYQTMLAPTGSIAILADCSCSAEPVFSLAFDREVMKQADGEHVKMTEVNPWFKRALESLAGSAHQVDEAVQYAAENGTIRDFDGELSKKDGWQEIVHIYQTARDVSMEGHVLMQAAWQEGLDQACSKTINLSNDAALEDVEKAYKLAWKSKCKGITVYRDGCRDGVQGQVQPMKLKAKEPEAVEVADKRDINELMRKYFPDTVLDRGQLEELHDVQETLYIKQRTPLGKLHLFLVHEGGEPKELFGQISKGGEQPAADLEAICRLSSLVLRLGGSIDMVLKQVERIGTSTLTPTADGRIMSIPDGVSVALKRAIKELQNSADTDLKQPEPSRTITKQRRENQFYKEKCPDCGAELYENSGCQSCTNPACGFARC